MRKELKIEVEASETFVSDGLYKQFKNFKMSTDQKVSEMVAAAERWQRLCESNY